MYPFSWTTSKGGTYQCIGAFFRSFEVWEDGTDILKIPNYSFYDTASIIEDIDSINSLKRIYGKSISIKDDLSQISEEDRIIFKSL